MNLLLADYTSDAQSSEEGVDEALVGLLAADGPNLVLAGRRQVDASVMEIAWVDDQDPGNHVMLVLDSDIPARWLAVIAPDEHVRGLLQAALTGVAHEVLDAQGRDESDVLTTTAVCLRRSAVRRHGYERRQLLWHLLRRLLGSGPRGDQAERRLHRVFEERARR